MDHLFPKWSSLKKKLKGKFIYLFLDYDGTLTPIVRAPENAMLSGDMRSLLKGLSGKTNCKIAVISGRSIENLKRHVGLPGLVYVGNHGFEIAGPKIDFKSPIVRRYETVLKKIKRALREKLLNIKGAFVEDKGITLSVHYRLAEKKDIPRVEAIFHETAIVYEVQNDIMVKPGKMVLEVRPPIDWDKGKAALWLLARQKFILREKHKNVLPVCLGDDVTDEDLFRAAKDDGITVFVGKPKKSHAQYYLKDTSEVYRFLTEIKKALK